MGGDDVDDLDCFESAEHAELEARLVEAAEPVEVAWVLAAAQEAVAGLRLSAEALVALRDLAVQVTDDLAALGDQGGPGWLEGP